jgi:hypothetical protein
MGPRERFRGFWFMLISLGIEIEIEIEIVLFAGRGRREEARVWAQGSWGEIQGSEEPCSHTL